MLVEIEVIMFIHMEASFVYVLLVSLLIKSFLTGTISRHFVNFLLLLLLLFICYYYYIVKYVANT